MDVHAKEVLNSILCCHEDSVESLIHAFCPFIHHGADFDLIVLWEYFLDSGYMKIYAFVTCQGVIIQDEKLILGIRGRKEFNSFIDDKFHFFPDSRGSAAIQDMMEEFPVPQPFSVITVQTKKEEGVYLVMSICKSGGKQYNRHNFDFININYTDIVLNMRYIMSRIEVEIIKKHIKNERQTILKRLGYIGCEPLIGEESGLRGMVEILKSVAPLSTTVLIVGETGVGKEMVASAIHRLSRRASEPMVSVNCGAIPDSLLDSELFGHEKGAFTDARHAKSGYFEQADGGTLFLDEIGELSLSAQVRLLRLLQERHCQRVGGTRNIEVDVRVIAATNRDLKAMVKKKLFRKDLWFRINTFPIYVPALRERKEDIPAMANYFRRSKGRELSLPWGGVFAEEAMAQLQAYDWPGNVRELQSVIERSLILSQGRPMAFPNLLPDPYFEKRKDTPAAQAEPAGGGIDGFPSLSEVLARHISCALKASKGRVAGHGGAAHLLDMNPSTLRAKIKKLGINMK